MYIYDVDRRQFDCTKQVSYDLQILGTGIAPNFQTVIMYLPLGAKVCTCTMRCNSLALARYKCGSIVGERAYLPYSQSENSKCWGKLKPSTIRGDSNCFRPKISIYLLSIYLPVLSYILPLIILNNYTVTYLYCSFTTYS